MSRQLNSRHFDGTNPSKSLLTPEAAIEGLKVGIIVFMQINNYDEKTRCDTLRAFRANTMPVYTTNMLRKPNVDEVRSLRLAANTFLVMRIHRCPRTALHPE